MSSAPQVEEARLEGREELRRFVALLKTGSMPDAQVQLRREQLPQ